MSDETRSRTTPDIWRRWYGDITSRGSEADHLRSIAGQLDAISAALAPIERGDWGPFRSGSLDPVGLATRRFAVAVRRLADAEEMQSEPVWSPKDEHPVSDRSIPHPEPASTIAEVDAFSCLLFGDLLLEEIARAQLVRLTGEGGSWVQYLDRLDDHSDPMRTTARELNWTLRAARNRLVAHRGDGFALGVGRGGHGEISLTALGGGTDWDSEYDEASAILRGVAMELGMEHGEDWEFHELLDLVEFAGAMDREQRRKVDRAFRLAGYGSVPFQAIARLVRDLVLDHARSVGAVEA